MDVVIVDYGAGNLHSVAKAVEKTGWRPLVSSRPEDTLHARALILPGVGAAADTMKNLTAAGMVEPVKQFIASGRPFLGVCMGLHALMTYSEEDGGQACLDVIPGRVKKLAGGDGLKVPHMGWNNVRQLRPHPIFRGIPDDAYFYFVHSYHCVPEDNATVIGDADYGESVTAAVAKDNIVATQFHPEKSGRHGLMIYANFIADALGGGAK
ncbi:MAG: imidazole glycerol phosphate synthase subunit HisH [Dehalococcoidia bacterium]